MSSVACAAGNFRKDISGRLGVISLALAVSTSENSIALASAHLGTPAKSQFLMPATGRALTQLRDKLVPEFVNVRHVGTRAPEPKCLPRVPKDEKCELYEHYCARCVNKNRWLSV